MSFASSTNTGSIYAKEIKGFGEDIKRLNEQKKKIQEQKKRTEGYLYQYMRSHGLEEIDGISLKKVTPKPKTITKKKKEKLQDAIDLCRQVGIPDPEGFYTQFSRTQKGKIEEQS